MWLCDHIGLLVVYRFAELEPVAAYIGGSIADIWAKLKPMIEGERKKRSVAESANPGRYQVYFQALAEQIGGGSLPPPDKLIRRRRRFLRQRSMTSSTYAVRRLPL